MSAVGHHILLTPPHIPLGSTFRYRIEPYPRNPPPPTHHVRHVLPQIAVLSLACAGKFTLWGAVLVDVGTALAVILNGMTVLRWSRFPPGQNADKYECAAERNEKERRCGLCEMLRSRMLR